MAAARSIVNLRNPSISFHPTTYGENIRLENNGLTAIRSTSFDHGITFSNRPISIGERIHFKVVRVADSCPWLTSLAVGFTHADPSRIQSKDLNASATPQISKVSCHSYIKYVHQSLSHHTILALYFNQRGAFYFLDGKEWEICNSINYNQPLWAVLDIRGNVAGVQWTMAPQTTDNSREFFAKYSKKPDKLPIRYFTNLSADILQQVRFFSVYGPELEVLCENKVVLRKHVQNLSRPYIFVNFSMAPRDELFVRILSIDPNYQTLGAIGFTNASPSALRSIEELPAHNLDNLYDRPEFWIFLETLFDEKSEELDEYRIVFGSDGVLRAWRNHQKNVSEKVLAHVDPNLKYYPFFFLNGRVNALSLFGLISTTIAAPGQPHHPRVQTETADTESNLCQICYENQIDCVQCPCGHMFFCFNCTITYEQSSGRICPICRQPYTNILKIADD